MCCVLENKRTKGTGATGICTEPADAFVDAHFSHTPVWGLEAQQATLPANLFARLRGLLKKKKKQNKTKPKKNPPEKPNQNQNNKPRQLQAKLHGFKRAEVGHS